MCKLVLSVSLSSHHNWYAWLVEPVKVSCDSAVVVIWRKAKCINVDTGYKNSMTIPLPLTFVLMFNKTHTHTHPTNETPTGWAIKQAALLEWPMMAIDVFCLPGHNGQ